MVQVLMVAHRTLQGAKHRPALATAPAELQPEHAAGSANVASFMHYTQNLTLRIP